MCLQDKAGNTFVDVRKLYSRYDTAIFQIFLEQQACCVNGMQFGRARKSTQDEVPLLTYILCAVRRSVRLIQATPVPVGSLTCWLSLYSVTIICVKMIPIAVYLQQWTHWPGLGKEHLHLGDANMKIFAGSCQSKICYIDGQEGVLLYRG